MGVVAFLVFMTSALIASPLESLSPLMAPWVLYSAVRPWMVSVAALQGGREKKRAGGVGETGKKWSVLYVCELRKGVCGGGQSSGGAK